MHPENTSRDTLIKRQLERILAIKARESGVTITSNGEIAAEILTEWKKNNRDNIKKWHLEAEAAVDSFKKQT